MQTHSVAFVSGPYKDLPESSTPTHIDQARWCAVYLWDVGYYVICPHLNTGGFETLTHQPPKVFLDFCLHIIRSGVVDLLVMLPKWTESFGSRQEFKLARRLDIPIYTWTPGTSLVRFDVY